MSDRLTVVHGGTIVTSDGPLAADIIIKGELIAGIVSDASEVSADQRIDATGLIVVPGAIDVHTHFREPDDTLVEGFDTGSQGALAGGITTAVEMPQASPTSSTAEHIRTKRKLVEQNSRIDMALWGGVVGQSADELQGMIDEGIVALKAFMPASSPGFPKADDQVLLDTFSFLADNDPDLPFGIHCENDTLVAEGIARMQAAGRNDPLAHAESRGPLVETEAIHRAIFFAELTGGRLYVCHVASADGLELVRQARERGVWVEAETCPQYLALDLSDLEARGPFARCAPALRSREEVERIWEYVENGTVDVVSSDHCGYTMEQKMNGMENIWNAPLGCSGIQTIYPCLFDEMVNQRDVGLQRFVEVSASSPAQIFGMYPRKGVIQVGSDADLAFYAPNSSWQVNGADLLHRNKWTPFEGKTIGSSVVMTMLRGEVAFDASRRDVVVVQPGYGKFIGRDYGLSDGE